MLTHSERYRLSQNWDHQSRVLASNSELNIRHVDPYLLGEISLITRLFKPLLT